MALNIRLEEDELEEVRRAIGARRGEIEGLRKKLEKVGVDTVGTVQTIEVLDRVRAAIAEIPEDMFSGLGGPLELPDEDPPEDVDPEAGEVSE